MNALVRKIRGMLGLSAIGGALGAVLGGGWGLLASMMAGGIHPVADALMWSGFWGVFGATTSAAFALLLTSIDGRRSLDELSTTRAALLGGGAGAIFPFLVTFAMSGSLMPWFWSMMLPVGVICGGLGAVLTGGLVSVAKAGNRVGDGRTPSGLLADE